MTITSKNKQILAKEKAHAKLLQNDQSTGFKGRNHR